MATRPKRKVTYSLPEELIESISNVVRDGAAPSYSAFVEEALSEGVRRAKEEALARAFNAAASDPDFLDDVEQTTHAFRHVDTESPEGDE
jgi:Arc/MetJ-type ribon-helix-helix transcriptional regulator